MHKWTKKPRCHATLAALLLAVLTSCNLENELDVVLPTYPDKLVVECYLEAGTVPRLTVLESGPYLPDVPDRPTITLPTASTPVLGVALPSGQSVAVPTDVTASLTLPNGQAVALRFAPGIDPVTRKYFTHVGTATLAMQPGQRFALTVQDTRGRRVTGTAGVPTLVPIDSVRYGFNGLSGNDRRANFITRWTDPAATVDYYRLLLNNGRDDINDSASDSPLEDRLFNGQSYTSLTTYRFRSNDTLTATLFHMEPEYYSFQQSIREAVRATGNPFAQPARIRNTVQGGLGVFAVLVADRRTLILR